MRKRIDCGGWGWTSSFSGYFPFLNAYRKREHELKCLDMSIYHALVAISAILAVARTQPNCTPSQTPRDIETRFLRGCVEQNLSNATCQAAWRIFANAWQSKNPANVMSSDYEPYFNEIPIDIGLSQNLFWSGTQDLVGLISCMSSSGVNVVSSFNSPSARIINSFGRDVNWCGTMGGSIDYDTLCPCNPVEQFWREFSYLFAQLARGTFFYLGNGERDGGTYNEKGFFATVELPNLNMEEVMSAVVLVAHRKGVGESCGQGSLVKLKKAIQDVFFKYTCYDVYGDLSTQPHELSECASNIIQAEQQGNKPEPNDCFSKEESGTQGMTSAKTGLLLIATPLLSMVFCYYA